VNLAACAALTLGPEMGTWYRATELQFAATPISTAHTTTSPTRFSAGPRATTPFEILYLGDSPLVAQFEGRFLFGDPLVAGSVIASPQAFAIVNVAVRLQQVADLTQVSEQQLLETTVQELTGDWHGYQLRSSRTAVRQPVGVAPTQQLGEALYATSRIEGFRAVSAKLPFHMTLVVFPQRLLLGSRLEFRYDPLQFLQVIDGQLPLPTATPTKRRKKK
jgi:hypothetical protein